MSEVSQQNASALKTVSLSSESKGRLEDLLRRFPMPTPEAAGQHRVGLLRATVQLDTEALEAVFTLSFDPHSESALLIKNSPVGELPPGTPLDGDRCFKGHDVSENYLLALGFLLGQPVAFPREKKGELAANLVPLPEQGYSVSNAGYLVPLDLHSDLVHLGQNTPAFVFLLCLRGDPRGEAKTFHVDARAALALLDPADVSVLRTPRFRIELPASFAHDGEEHLSPPMPVVAGPAFAPQLNGELNSTRPLDERAARALSALGEACRRPGVTSALDLRDGDCLILRNRAALHGRSAYSPQFEGDARRWLQRLYVMADAWQARHAMSSRRAATS
jgi:L-asparagine oxygenase